MKPGLVNIGIGALLVVIGLIVTAVSYSAVSHSGGHYVVAWGAVVVGAWRFIVGLFQLLHGAVSVPPAVPQTAYPNPAPPAPQTAAPQTIPPQAAPPPIAPEPYFMGQVPNTAQFANPAAAPPAVAVIGIVLLVHAAIRFIFLALSVVQTFSYWGRYPQIALFSVVIPAAFIAGGIVVGIMAVRRSPLARPFGLTLCILGLILLVYGVGVSFTRLSYFPITYWFLTLLNLGVYVAGLIVFLRSPSPQSGPSPATSFGRPMS